MDRPPWYFFHRTRDVTHEDHLGVVIVGTTTFFWTEDGWQTQPKELWVWQLFPGNWETRIWAPKAEVVSTYFLITHELQSFYPTSNLYTINKGANPLCTGD